MPSLFKVAKLPEALVVAELIGFTLVVLSRAAMSGESPLPSLTFVAEIAVIDNALPSKAISLLKTLTVTSSP